MGESPKTAVTVHAELGEEKQTGSEGVQGVNKTLEEKARNRIECWQEFAVKI